MWPAVRNREGTGLCLAAGILAWALVCGHGTAREAGGRGAGRGPGEVGEVNKH